MQTEHDDAEEDVVILKPMGARELRASAKEQLKELFPEMSAISLTACSYRIADYKPKDEPTYGVELSRHAFDKAEVTGHQQWFNIDLPNNAKRAVHYFFVLRSAA